MLIGCKIDRSTVRIIVMSLFFCVFYMLSVTDAMSAIAGAGGGLLQECPYYERQILGNIYSCITTMLNQAVTTFIAPVINALAGFVAILCLFSIILYGYRVAFGAVKYLRKDTIIFVIKISIIVALCLNTTLLLGYRETLIDLTNATTEHLLGGFITELSGCGGVTSGNTDQNVIGIFRLFDCVILGMLDGIKENPGTTVGYSLLTVVGLLLLSYYAAPLAGMLIGVFMTMISTAMWMMLIYVQAIFALTVLTVLVPIILPLMLFKYFNPAVEKFWMLFVFYTLQPIIMSAYIALMLAVLAFQVGLMKNLLLEAKRVDQDPDLKHSVSLFSTDKQGTSPSGRNAACEKLDSSGSTRGGSAEECFHQDASLYPDGEEGMETSIKTAKSNRVGANRVYDETKKATESLPDAPAMADGQVVDGDDTEYEDQSSWAWLVEKFGDVKTYMADAALNFGSRVLGFQGMLLKRVLPWDPSNTIQLILYMFSMIITFWMMQSFLRELPKNLDRFVRTGVGAEMKNKTMQGIQSKYSSNDVDDKTKLSSGGRIAQQIKNSRRR